MIFHIHAGYEKSTTKIFNLIKLFQSWKVCYHFTAYANLSIIFYGICKILSTILWYMKILQCHFMVYANLSLLFYGICKSLHVILWHIQIFNPVLQLRKYLNIILWYNQISHCDFICRSHNAIYSICKSSQFHFKATTNLSIPFMAYKNLSMPF